MAFKKSKKPSYKTKIIVNTPNDKGGYDKSDFMAEFKFVDMDEIAELRELQQKDVLERVLVGWSDFLDENNQPVPFNEAELHVMLSIPQAFAALSQGFWGSIFKAREKN